MSENYVSESQPGIQATCLIGFKEAKSSNTFEVLTQPFKAQPTSAGAPSLPVLHVVKHDMAGSLKVDVPCGPSGPRPA